MVEKSMLLRVERNENNDIQRKSTWKDSLSWSIKNETFTLC